MIEAVFQHHLTFLAVAIAITLTAGLVAFVLTGRRATRGRATLYGLWAASATGPAILTSWSGSGVLTYECAVNTDLAAALTSTQGQLNVALFAPYGLFAALATRRPLFAAVTGTLFTVSVETAQATIPFISRLCDTDDLITNTLGACAGAAIGALMLRRLSDGTPTPQATGRRTAAVFTPAVALIGVVWLVAIDPVRTQVPIQEVPTANAAQAAALNEAVTDAFSSAYRPSNAFYVDNGDGTASVTASLPGGGFAELSWPDREKFTAHFTPSAHGEGVRAYKIPGISRPITTPDEARKIATAYASRYAPWAAPGSKVTVRPIDDKADIGWIVEWRRWKNNVLMPMRLDIAIEPSGYIIDLIARHVADPDLPQPKISEAKAWEIFETHHKLKPGQGQRQQPVYLAQRRDGHWRIHWLLSVRDGSTLRSAVIDATDASIHDAATLQDQSGTQPQ
ncbi:VanZ family protein [Streptomyces sp. NPDC006527]|uniref:VanZ family protein n=1 Tax=Streptomyces sp. NPDC006527 TaxID=3364749 RepID=UPI003677EB38